MKSRRHILARLAALPVLGMLLMGVLRPAPAADYVIQPEDVLAVKVAGEPGLSQNYPVNPKGEITMDMAGAIKLSGLTIKEAEAAVKLALSKFIKEALLQVSIFVVPDVGTGGSGKALVFGEVNKPGSIKVKADTRFLDALADAGQPTDKADTRRISLVRRGEKAQILDLDAVLKDPDLNVVLMSGDTITVPSKVANGVTVTGEVQNPGPRSLENVRTVFEAVKSANPTPKADWSRISVRSRGAATPEILDLRRARNAPEEDTHALREGDSIFVPSREVGFASLSGAVQNPGDKEVSGSTNLWDLVTKSGGGFVEKANRYRISINRPGQPERIVNLAAVAQGTKSPDAPEFEVAAGDRVFVPMSGEARLRGEVKEPGPKSLDSTNNVLDFILGQGGGFSEYADRANVTVTREGKARKLNLTDYASGLLNPDVPELMLQPGDTITVPRDEKNRFVIVGGVNKPGNYPYVPGMTLIDAISTAGSFSPLAGKKFVVARASAFDDQGKMKPIDDVAPKDGTEAGSNSETVSTASDSKDEKKRDNKKKRSKKEDEDKLPSNMVMVDFEKFKQGDPTQNVRILPGDRILIPEEMKSNKLSMFDKITRLGGIAAGALFY